MLEFHVTFESTTLEQNIARQAHRRKQKNSKVNVLDRKSINCPFLFSWNGKPRVVNEDIDRKCLLIWVRMFNMSHH